MLCGCEKYSFWHLVEPEGGTRAGCAGPFKSECFDHVKAKPITIADLEAKIMRMRDEMKGGKVVAAIDTIHAGRKRMLQWPDFSS